MVRIAIVGTRGIPNRYGGFEQNAENLAAQFHDAGHDVTVFNPHDHPYKLPTWQGVKIRRRFWHERRLGALGIFLYDYLCLAAAFRENFDIVLELGYAPSALYHFLRPAKGPKIITNMDGLEWRRAKWGPFARRILLFCEGLASRTSDAMIADNPAIREYLLAKYKRQAYYVPHGAALLEDPDPSVCGNYGVAEREYYMLLARMEPENNIETVLDGTISSGDGRAVLVVGGCDGRYGRFLKGKYRKYPHIRFLGAVYEQRAVSSLRRFAKLYFHGHSVGGTNPSLLEAMGAGAYIAAHDNVFNRSVLREHALYFTTADDVAHLMKTYNEEMRDAFAAANRQKLEQTYNWNLVGRAYLTIFETLLNDGG